MQGQLLEEYPKKDDRKDLNELKSQVAKLKLIKANGGYPQDTPKDGSHIGEPWKTDKTPIDGQKEDKTIGKLRQSKPTKTTMNGDQLLYQGYAGRIQENKEDIYQSLSPNKRKHNEKLVGSTPSDNAHITKYNGYSQRTVISNFVQELTQQLDRNEMKLRRQIRMHNDTKTRLTIVTEDYKQILLTNQSLQQKCRNLAKQNELLKLQLKDETFKKVHIEDQLLQKTKIMQRYEQVFSSSCQGYEEELEKMDKIYLSIEKEFI